MNTTQLRGRATAMKKQADALLQSTKLIEILKKYGDVHLIGSYVLDVMSEPDIDIVVQAEDTRKSSVEALQEIIGKRLFYKVEYGDFVAFPVDNRPKGYILVLKTVVNQVAWETEVWFVGDASKQLAYSELLKSKLTSQHRIEILKAKVARQRAGYGKHHLSSHKIYERIMHISLDQLKQ